MRFFERNRSKGINMIDGSKARAGKVMEAIKTFEFLKRQTDIEDVCKYDNLAPVCHKCRS